MCVIDVCVSLTCVCVIDVRVCHIDVCVIDVCVCVRQGKQWLLASCDSSEPSVHCTRQPQSQSYNNSKQTNQKRLAVDLEGVEVMVRLVGPVKTERREASWPLPRLLPTEAAHHTFTLTPTG